MGEEKKPKKTLNFVVFFTLSIYVLMWLRPTFDHDAPSGI